MSENKYFKDENEIGYLKRKISNLELIICKFQDVVEKNLSKLEK